MATVGGKLLQRAAVRRRVAELVIAGAVGEPKAAERMGYDDRRAECQPGDLLFPPFWAKPCRTHHLYRRNRR